MDGRGRLAAGCSTSGTPFKEPGRVGDSPLVGAGAYCDGRVGGAAATGDGDVLLRFCPSFATVEAMRSGRSPQGACEQVLERMLDAGVRPEAALIALDRDGRFGAAVIGRDDFPHAIWSPELDELRRTPRLAANR
jgi:isoaspartyl peptidase/L-asparaginase-like protein (Ntn-hydrolase superfamily)